MFLDDAAFTLFMNVRTPLELQEAKWLDKYAAGCNQ